MSERDRNWKYVDDSVHLSEFEIRARNNSIELGVTPLSPAAAAQLRVLAAASKAHSMIEIGTGAGVSGLSLLSASHDSHLTTIDEEAEHHAAARIAFAEAGIASSRYRFINGRAIEVLPRMNEGAYDLIFIDADPESVLEYVEHGLRLAKPGGLVVVSGGLSGVSDPTARDEASSALRALVAELAASSAVVSALSPAGEGLLQVVKLA